MLFRSIAAEACADSGRSQPDSTKHNQETKHNQKGTTVLATLPAPVRGRSPARTAYRLDPDRTVVDVTARQFWTHRVRARIPVECGQLILDRKDPMARWVRVDLSAALISTGLAARDEALRGPEMLDSASHPLIRFESVVTEQSGPERFQVEGDLYIRDRVVQLVLRVRVVELSSERVLIGADGSLRWADLNLGWGSRLERSGLLGRTLTVSLAAEFVA